MITTNDLVTHFSDLLEKLKNGELSSEKTRDLTLLYVKHKKETYDKEKKDEKAAGAAKPPAPPPRKNRDKD